MITPADDVVAVIELYEAPEQPPEPGFAPALVMSHAIGKGVIWESSL